MAISVYFNNKKITLPGAYATVAAGEQNDPRALDYGKCLIIDTGSFYKDKKFPGTENLLPNWGGGSGIQTSGTTPVNNGVNAIYRFDNIDDFRSFIKGGMYWQLANALFFPDSSNPAAVGVSEIMFVRAAQTTPATMTFNGKNKGVLKIITLDEGDCANGLGKNGEAATDNLATGYGFKVEKGVLDPAKYIFQIWRGTYTGVADDGVSFNEVSLDDAAKSPRLIIESPEVTKMQDLIDWANGSSEFNRLFSVDLANSSGVGDLDATDIKAVFTPASGGTQTYDKTYFDQVLASITNLDNSFVFTDIHGTNAYTDSNITALINHINNTAKFKKQLFIGAGEDEGEFPDSLTAAQELNSSRVCVVHGGVGMPSNALGVGYRWWGVMYNLCSILGRTAGKAPQIPVTNKSIGVSKLKHQLNNTDKKKALNAGVLVTVYNESLQKFVVLQGINTLQNNQVLFTGEGESFSIQFMRIVDQINKELIVNSEIDLLGAENGVNSNTLSAGILKNWTENYLLTRTATATSDNLLLSYRNVTVTKKDDYYLVTYGIVINNEINKIFFTGFVFKN